MVRIALEDGDCARWCARKSEVPEALTPSTPSGRDNRCGRWNSVISGGSSEIQPDMKSLTQCSKQVPPVHRRLLGGAQELQKPRDSSASRTFGCRHAYSKFSAVGSVLKYCALVEGARGPILQLADLLVSHASVTFLAPQVAPPSVLRSLHGKRVRTAPYIIWTVVALARCLA